MVIKDPSGTKGTKEIQGDNKVKSKANRLIIYHSLCPLFPSQCCVWSVIAFIYFSQLLASPASAVHAAGVWPGLLQQSVN